jgi:hypothetical protein
VRVIGLHPWGGCQDGIGVLKPEEMTVGKRLLAERFFRQQK